MLPLFELLLVGGFWIDLNRPWTEPGLPADTELASPAPFCGEAM